MSENQINQIPFTKGDWVIDKNNSGQPGQYTGKWNNAGSHIMVQLSFPGGGVRNRPLACLESISSSDNSITGQMRACHFGRVVDLKRIITFEKLKGTLHDVIYSMEAAQIDFYPYQFKPVLKFINSPTERLIIADEVGLGKTIESALIWMELQARRQAKRLLVVCPKFLAEKWREELRSKFLLDARLAEFNDLQQEIDDLRTEGSSHAFILIATYTGLRPPKSELRLLKEPPEEENQNNSAKTTLLRDLRHWTRDFDPFDLVIFDEAHYMRNPSTTTFHLGESLSAAAGAVLCVSATPVNNSNTDLHSLLRLIDESFFETQALFEELLAANRPAVQASNALSCTPPDMTLLEQAVLGMSDSRFISRSPLFKQFLEKLERLDANDKSHLAKCQDLAEKLNLLGGFVSRTRRVQVKENRPIRDPKVLTVRYSQEEMHLYRAILQIVRAKCRIDHRPFHVFQVLGLQLRAASCLPAIAQEIRDGKFWSIEDLFNEALGENLADDFIDELIDDVDDIKNLNSLLSYDFIENDSKYRELQRLLKDIVPNEKIIIFAYYRPTLAYLRNRLTMDHVETALIHGGIPTDQRWNEIDRFKDPAGPRVLLSSEVGSEGIDLQFCRVLVNYDLPWNPMRVEQRIGRIDRVGQQAKKLSIINFKVCDTIEERLFERLHEKLQRFANSLGDLESVIGKEVQKLTIELLSKDLTPEEEATVMELSELVIEERLLQIQALEESGDALIALSDYVQRKIEEDRQKGRFIQPEELEGYLIDFFEREFQGCELFQNTPADGCLRIRMNPEAQSSLSAFIHDDRTLSARPFRQRDFVITFRREVIQNLPATIRRTVHFANHLSPLIRWITKINREREHSFYNVSAIQLTYPRLTSGHYCYRIERWKLKGLFEKEVLAYGIQPLNNGLTLVGDAAEEILQHLLYEGKDWDYVDCDKELLITKHEELENKLTEGFNVAVSEFDAENGTAHQIKVQRVKAIFDRRIAQDVKRLKTLNEAGRSQGVIKAAEGRLRKAIEIKEQRIKDLDNRAKSDVELAEVAAGIFSVVNPPS